MTDTKVRVTDRTWLRKADDDVVVPKAVERDYRARYPEHEVEGKLEEARGYYRQARDLRRKELADMRKPDVLGVRPVEPSKAQAADIAAHSARKKLWPKKKRKLRYPVNKYPANWPSEKTGTGVAKEDGPPYGVYNDDGTTRPSKRRKIPLKVQHFEEPEGKKGRRALFVHPAGETKRGRQVYRATAVYSGNKGPSDERTLWDKGKRNRLADPQRRRFARKEAKALYRESDDDLGWTRSFSVDPKDRHNRKLSKSVEYSVQRNLHGDGDDYVEAHKDGKNVGYLRLTHEGKIHHVKVQRQERRKGIATGMFERAKAEGMNPTHTEALTKKGKAWKESVGKAWYGAPSAAYANRRYKRRKYHTLRRRYR